MAEKPIPTKTNTKWQNKRSAATIQDSTTKIIEKILVKTKQKFWKTFWKVFGRMRMWFCSWILISDLKKREKHRNGRRRRISCVSPTPRPSHREHVIAWPTKRLTRHSATLPHLVEFFAFPTKDPKDRKKTTVGRVLHSSQFKFLLPMITS